MFASIIIGENPPPPPLNSLDTKYLIWDQKELEKLFLHVYVNIILYYAGIREKDGTICSDVFVVVH